MSSGDASSLPSFPSYLREKPGETRIYLLALGFGTLARRGRCLGIASPAGSFVEVVWPYTAKLGRDRGGLLVTDSESGAKLRLGDRFEFGGGGSPGEPEQSLELTEPIPAECRAGGVAVINPGFRRSRH